MNRDFRRFAEAWRILMAKVAEGYGGTDLRRFTGIIAERVGVPTGADWYGDQAPFDEVVDTANPASPQGKPTATGPVSPGLSTDAARALWDAARAYGAARRDEEIAKRASFAAGHRGPAWFARCVAGEARAAAEGELFAAWEAWAARGHPEDGAAGEGGVMA